MALESASSLGIGSSSVMETSQAGLPSLVGQIETQLYSSEVYCQIVAQLQAMLGEAAAHAQIMVRTVAREAIQLACEHLRRPHYSEIDAPSAIAESGRGQQPQAPAISPVSDSLYIVNPSLESNSIKSNTPDATQITKPSDRAVNSARSAPRDRSEHLRQLGEELRQVREAQSISLEELRDLTQVPLHTIAALESGRADRLPEDVYVRGFIRRIGNQLGLDGDRLASALPATDPVKSVVPSWYRPESPSGYSFNLTHLYVGYAALIASALGTLQWVYSQTMPKSVLPPAQPSPPPSADANPKQSAAPISVPGLKKSQAGLASAPDIAPPEVLDY